MIEIYPNLFIGNVEDYELRVKNEAGWRIVHACKEPYHRLELGYTGRSASKDHPEYLIARRENRLILNLIDAPKPEYIPKIIIDTALQFINESLGEYQVLVHCNLGESRSPVIGLLYLVVHTDKLDRTEFGIAESQFQKIYPPYNPGKGMYEFAKIYFNNLLRKS